MKKLLLAALFAFPSFAVEIKFIGPCGKDFIMKTTLIEHYANVGEATIASLKNFNIPYQGSEAELVSAFETPVGEAAVEVVSDIEMRVYGWCFSIDEVAPDVYPNVVSTEGVKQITWTFGFARYYKGEWITQCTPAWTVRPAFLCDDLPPSER